MSVVRGWLLCLLVGCAGANASIGHGPPPPAAGRVDAALFDLTVVPPRPALTFIAASGAAHDTIRGADTLGRPDTNDAHAYYDAGVRAMHTDDVAGAATAFQWASRLDPSWAEPYFGRWYALRKLKPPFIPIRAVPGGETSRSFMVDTLSARLDSLYGLAMVRNPFFDETLAMQDYVDKLSRRPNFGAPDVRRFRSALLAYDERAFDDVVRELGRLIAKYPNVLLLYTYRAKAQYYLGQYDSAAATLTAVVTRMATNDTGSVDRVYRSKAMLLYAIAHAEQRAHQDTLAHESYRQVLSDNLGFYMAHLHLASDALAAHDTVAALTEAGIAATIQPRDPVVQLFLGYSLFNARRLDEAVDHLRAAIASDSDYAVPHFYLAQTLELKHDTAGALGAYRAYLAHASRHDVLREPASMAIFTLGGQAGN